MKSGNSAMKSGNYVTIFVNSALKSIKSENSAIKSGNCVPRLKVFLLIARYLIIFVFSIGFVFLLFRKTI